MEWLHDEIVDIPENRVRYFGGHGKMLLPSPPTIAALIDKVPKHKLLTTDLLRETLREQFEVDGVCPVTTRKALQVVANDASRKVAYWRVIRPGGELFANYPGGIEGHATHLLSEGFSIDSSGKTPKVNQFKESLVRFN